MSQVVRSLTYALLLWGTSISNAQDPPNHADSTVPYDLPGSPKYDYSETLHKSLLFYHSQRSGKLGPNRRLAWRGDSCHICTGPKGEDLSGGYYEAANTMKWGLPLAWTLSQLAFNVYVFGDAMKSVGQLTEAKEGVKWGTDYLVNCVSDSENFVGQFGVSAVGDVDIDFGYFGPPEEYEIWVPRGIQRPEGIAYINSTNPSSEILGESAAALAAAAVIFADSDKAYSDLVLGHAKDLYTRGKTYNGTYMDSKHPNQQTVKGWYPSSIYTDELAWAAAWLYIATKDETYRHEADGWIEKAKDHSTEYSWDEKLPGAYTLLFMQTRNETYKAGVEEFLNAFYPGGTVKQTAKGLTYQEAWGSLRYACNTGFIFMAYAKTIGYREPAGQKAVTFAAQQINYILGDCGRSWIVGFGKDYPLRPYHKSSYNSFIDFPMRGQDNGDIGGDFMHSTTVNRFILYGAVVGGPSWDDSFLDNREKYEYTDNVHDCSQVTQDYNAAFTGLSAAMIDYYGHGNFKAWTDCGLDLGWSHPNATNPPQWPANDCYHTCNTNCTTNTSTDGGSNNGGNNNTGNGNGGGQNQNAALKNSAVAVLLTTMVAGLTASFLCF